MNEFGQFMSEKRIAADLTIREAARSIGFSPQFLNDIEKGNRMFPPNQERIDAIHKTYKLSDSEFEECLNLMGKHRNEIAPDIRDYVMNNDSVSESIRLARDVGATAEDWEHFNEYLQKVHEPIFKYDFEWFAIERHSVEDVRDWNFASQLCKKEHFIFYHITCDSHMSIRLLERFGFHGEARGIQANKFLETLHLAHLPNGTEKLFLDTGTFYKEIPICLEDSKRIAVMKNYYADFLKVPQEKLDTMLLKQNPPRQTEVDRE